MRVIILTQYFPPETGAPQNRLSDLATRLQQMGHEVVILTAKPSYPLGRFFPGFKGYLWKHALFNNIKVIHCWLYPTRSKNMPLRLFNYLSFVISSAIIGSFVLPKADILLVESPPLFLGLAARWLSLIKKARLIFNVSDLYPETAVSLGHLQNPFLRKLFYRFEAWCYSRSFLITGQTEGIVRSISERFPEKTVFLLTNGVDLKQFAAVAPSTEESFKGKRRRPFVLGYAGIHGHAQKLEVVLEAARLLQQSTDVRIIFYGDGPLKYDLVEKAAQWQLLNVQFDGHRTHGEILHIMRSWDAGLVPLMNTPLMAGALPSKMFEVMAAGLPVVLSAPCGEASELIGKANAGISVPPENPRRLASAIEELSCDRMLCLQLGSNGRDYVAKHYNRAEISQRFVSLVEQMLFQTKGKA